MVNKAIIKENFSKHAREYDQYSKVQNFCASKLINEIGCKQCHNILDLGCGTGNYTKLLRDKFPKSLIKAVDISRAMVEVSKEKLSNQKIEFIIADAEQFKLDNGFDLVTSNASFQ